MKYKCEFPFIDDMGTVASVIVSDKMSETKKQEALWHLNKCREHDCLKPLTKLPPGCSFTQISE
jgi:hypothetical protein